MRRGPAFLGAVAALALAACSSSDQPGLGPTTRPSPLSISVPCRADVVARELSCEPITGFRTASPGHLVIGGQGTYVLLSSSNTGYNAGTQIFTADVTVENRSAQAMGTTDGTFQDPEGVEIFFESGPTGVGGAVTVANPDTTGDFTGSNQPAFWYRGTDLAPPPNPLVGGATSNARTWQFNVPAGVTSFSFTVQIRANVAQQNGVLRWRADGATINGVSCSSATFCFAVGDGGTIRRWPGGAWTFNGSGTNADLKSVFLFSSTAGLAVGNGGTVLRWNGSYWKPLNSGTATDLKGVWCASATDCFMVGGTGMWEWNGTTISNVTNAFPDAVDAVWGTAANSIFVAGADGTISLWNGTGLSDIGPPPANNLPSLWGTSATDLYTVTDNGQVWHRSGTTWTQEANGLTTNALNSVFALGADVYAVGAAGTVLKKTGSTWSDITATVNLTQGLNAVAGFGSDVFVAGVGGTISHSSNSGTGWGTTSVGTTAGLNAVWGTSGSNVYAVGDNGTIVRWNGSGLTALTSGTAQALNGLHGLSGTDIWAVGNNGTILHSTNGTAWTPTTSGTANLRAVFAISATDVYAVGDTGAVRHYDGNNWSAVANVPDTISDGSGGTPVHRNLNGVWATGASNVYIVGDTGLIIHWNGTTWSQEAYPIIASFPQRNLRAVWGPDANSIWALGFNGVIIHSDNAIAPADTNGAGKPTPWAQVGLAVTDNMLALYGSTADDIYGVGEAGRIVHNNNGDVGSLNANSHWSSMTGAGATQVLRGVYAPSLTEAFIVGANGLFIRGVH
jgi:hypothetical protein